MKVTVVMPAYNAERTLEKTYREIPFDIVDEVILVDDSSKDRTVEIARSLGIRTIVHPENRGYGGNQKTCYTEALKGDGNIIVMLHPDYQYDPKLIPKMVAPIKNGEADAVFGSRLLSGDTRESGMPFYKYIGNKALTLIECVVLGKRYSELHTGYRAYSRKLLETIPFMENSDNFVFDTQLILQLMRNKFRLKEIPAQAKYTDESSTVSFKTSVIYGIQSLISLLKYLFNRLTT